MIRRGMILIVTILGMLLGCVGCGRTGSEPEQDVIGQRRDAAEAYMRKMATYMWRAEEDIFYTRDNKVLTDEDLANFNGDVMKIKAGRLYRGIPYSYAGASAWNFYDYASQPDEQGIASVSGLHWRSLNGASGIGACVGNDCSGAIELAWDYVGSSIIPANTASMTKTYGYLPVGDYSSNPIRNDLTAETCKTNGLDVMAQAYSGLKKADAVVKRQASYGHTMMVVENHVVLTEDGIIDPEQSYVTVLHQTTTYMQKEHKEFDPEYGEDVYAIYGIDDKCTYAKLFEQGYLPITCDVFLNPAPVAETYVTDTETEHNFDTIFKGSFLSNRILSALTVTITDGSGKVVMEGTCYEKRQTGQQVLSFQLDRFNIQNKVQQRGELNLEQLQPGNYHCTHVVRDAHGVEYTMRDFDFTVPAK